PHRFSLSVGCPPLPGRGEFARRRDLGRYRNLDHSRFPAAGSHRRRRRRSVAPGMAQGGTPRSDRCRLEPAGPLRSPSMEL
ncbi:uncharacterized protein METZ01_LOCUS172468, partial [marine metagenome]